MHVINGNRICKRKNVNVEYLFVFFRSLGCLVLEILSRGTLTVDVNYQQALPVYTLPHGISPQCTMFMQCCLQVNPANRHTSSMLLNHDWFKM